MGRYPYFSPEHLSLFRCDCCKQIDRIKLQQYISWSLLVKIDPQAFKQVLSNLLSNALKFTTEGAVKITTSTVHIDDNHAVIKMTIMDSGSGLSQEEQQQLFKRYSQTSAGRQQTGSGLGLMICKELIKNMQGDLSLESHPHRNNIYDHNPGRN